MKFRDDDTIAAIATPVGVGGISVIRISGPGALDVADRVFRGAKHLCDMPGYSVLLGRIVDGSGRLVDEALATVFREPHSYTGEDAVEISCHGGILVTHAVLDAVLHAGARQAGPGEFTKRAFLNGRIDLAQAEAVSDLIAAQSSRAQATSLEQLEGKLGERISGIRTLMVDLCALLEIDLDFTEEGLDLVSRQEVNQRIDQADALLTEMSDSFAFGRIEREGVRVVLAGKPNAGKSSLFNALLREDRAIVTEVPGTTRDVLEENITLSGLLFRLMDTAGLRDAVDIPEQEGVRRTRSRAQHADILIIVVDVTECRDTREACAAISLPESVQNVLVVFNKRDLLNGSGPPNVDFGKGAIPCAQLSVSATTGDGLNELRKRLIDLALGDRGLANTSVHVTNRRHWEALTRARSSLSIARESLKRGETNEFVAFDLREAIEALSEITGEVTNEEILNNIFSRFCIGK